jgi:biopolymer transport protein ExbD
MVAAPLATVDIAVDLPSSNTELRQKLDKPIYLTLKPDLTLAIGDKVVATASAPDSATLGNKDDRIFLGADISVRYGDVMAAMNKLRAANYLKVALVSLKIRQAK